MVLGEEAVAAGEAEQSLRGWLLCGTAVYVLCLVGAVLVPGDSYDRDALGRWVLRREQPWWWHGGRWVR